MLLNNITIYTQIHKGIYMNKKCKKCNIIKNKIQFYNSLNTCKECYNLLRRANYKQSVCGYCKVEFRPGVKGRYKFCSEMCRFMIKVKKDSKTGCWLWQAGKDNLGYGNFVPLGKRRGLSHRESYRLFKGPIEFGKLILHSCHTPSCVAPDHLKQGTDAQNTQDKLDAVRQNSPKGENCHYSKLTEQDVLNIRSSNLKQKNLADKFKVKTETISAIIRRLTWKHI